LKHHLGGKTGTTSDYTDAWFLGFSPSVTCGAWVGFDNNQSLGKQETGAKAALPIWIAVMREAIAGKDDEQFLGDEEIRPLHRAALETPAKTHAALAIRASAAISPAQAAVNPALRTQPAPRAPKPKGVVKPASGITMNR
jgi:penicillin-binding protein 1A